VLSFLLITASLLASPPARCSPIFEAQLAFDASESVFEGVVVGHAGDPSRGWPLDSEVVPPPSVPLGPAGALLVVPTRTVHLTVTADTVTVLPSGLGAMCEPVFWPLDDLRAAYPAGTRLAVTAHATGETLARAPVLHAAWDAVLARALVSFDPWLVAGPVPDVEAEVATAPIPEVGPEGQLVRYRAVRGRFTFEFLRDLLALERLSAQAGREALVLKILGYQRPGGRLSSMLMSPECVNAAFVARHVPRPSARFIARVEAAGAAWPHDPEVCERSP